MMLVRSSGMPDTFAAWLSACACMVLSHWLRTNLRTLFLVQRNRLSRTEPNCQLHFFHQSCGGIFDQHMRLVIAHFKDLGRGRRTSLVPFAELEVHYDFHHPVTRRSKRRLMQMVTRRRLSVNRVRDSQPDVAVAMGGCANFISRS